MARIALLCPEFRGHLNPMLVLGRALRERGHDIVVTGHVDAAELAAAHGFAFRRLGTDDDHGWARGATAEIARTLSRRRGHSATAYTLSAIGRACTVHLRDLPTVLRGERIDVLLADQVCVAASTVCARVDLPFASVACALPINPDPAVPPVTMPWGPARGRLARMRNALLHGIGDVLLARLASGVHAERRRLGLPRWTIERSLSDTLQLAQQPDWFDLPRDRRPAALVHTGPFLLPDRDRTVAFDRGLLDGDPRPIVYASMGTLQNGIERVFHTIAAAVAALPTGAARLVIGLGGLDPAALGPLPGEAIAVRYAPQLEVLERASVAVLHAGCNGALEALAAGCPVLALPVTNDQPGVAARLAHARAGVVLPPRRRSVRALRDALAHVLGDRAQRARSRELAGRIARADGLATAADLVEQRLLGAADVQTVD